MRVWEDNFDWNGGVDPNKWEFDIGGHGWGEIFFPYLLYVYIYIYLTQIQETMRNNIIQIIEEKMHVVNYFQAVAMVVSFLRHVG